MTEKRKAAHGVTSTVNGRAEKYRAGASSMYDDTTTPAQRQQPSALLLTGAGNALTAAEIAQITGVKAREVTRAFQRERAAGTAAICASGAGFYLAQDAGELQKYLRAFDRRLSEMRKTRRGLEIALSRMTGQTNLFNRGQRDDADFTTQD